MVGWLDCLPNAVPVLSLFFAALSFLFSWHTARRQRNHSKSERRWDEYKETVYDPIRKEVDELRRLARECRHWSTFGPTQEDALKLLGALSFQLEELRIACKDADSHESTMEKTGIGLPRKRLRKLMILLPSMIRFHLLRTPTVVLAKKFRITFPGWICA